MRLFTRLVVLGSIALCETARGGSCGTDLCVRIEPQSQQVPLITSATFTVDIVADIYQPIVGWGLDVVLTMPGVIVQNGAPAIGPAWIGAAAADGDGLAGLAFPSSVSGVGIVLATLTFNPNALGTTQLDLQLTPGDLSEGFALDPTGFASVTLTSGSVTVVPEPTTALLLAGGLLLGRSTIRRSSSSR